MHDETVEKLETRLSRFRPRGAPAELRGKVLSNVHRELAAAQWDRRLGRAAAGLLALGVGLNATLVLAPPRGVSRTQLARGPAQQALVDAGATMAEATDAKTGQQFVRHLATLSGLTLTPEQCTAIDLAIERRFYESGNFGREG
jgi:hypothetical protein